MTAPGDIPRRDRDPRAIAASGRLHAAASLCPACKHVKLVRSDKDAVFYLCRLAATDPRFTKYPPQPVLDCAGFER
jgi:hypothetical protein